MTIIACSRTERSMMSDSLLASEDGARLGSVAKILRCKDGSLAGAAGDSGACWVFLRWAENGRVDEFPDLPKKKEFEGLVLTPAGEILVYWSKHPESMLDDWGCIGAGRDFAMGAMGAGANLQQAVEIACRFSTDCGGVIHRLELPPLKPTKRRTRG